MNIYQRFDKVFPRFLGEPEGQKYDLVLGRILDLLGELNYPQNSLPPHIHIAGTNGKGSVVAFLESIFREAGYTVGAYVSPHYASIVEVFRIDGQSVSDDSLQHILEVTIAAGKSFPASHFEALTAAAFSYLAESDCNIAIIETGLGGRDDATNVLTAPDVTAITSIDFDHQEYLGDTLESIAGHKAGIMKAGAPCVLGPMKENPCRAIEEYGDKLGVRTVAHGRDWHIEESPMKLELRFQGNAIRLPKPALPGRHQFYNAGVAAMCAIMMRDKMPASFDDIAAGIAKARWPGRLQVLTTGRLVNRFPETQLVVDGGHNEAAARSLADWLESAPMTTAIVIGMLESKNIENFVRHLIPHAMEFYALPLNTQLHSHQPEKIVETINRLGGKASQMNDLSTFAESDYRPPERLLFCGSLYLAGTVLDWNEKPK